MRSEGLSFYFEGLEAGTCLLQAAFTTQVSASVCKASASVRDENAMAMPIGSAAKVVTLEVSNVV